MHKAITAGLITLSLSAMALPAFADYAEGDPRPAPLPSQASAADVSAQTAQWLKTAPTIGYPEGNPRDIPQVAQNSRAQVNAESVAWVKSGLGELAYADSPMDANGPGYRRAMNSYLSMSRTPANK